jgi:predicted O-methyltransferase YrrM
MEKLTSYDLSGADPNPMTAAEVDALKSLVRLLPGMPIIIQIGAERGCSTLAMLEENPDAFIFSIDIGAAETEKQHLIEAGLPWQRVVRGLGRSQDIGEAWPVEWFCNLLFIDGDHRHPGIDDDINIWKPQVIDYGIIAFHDYIPNPAPHIHGRVAEAVDEWQKREPLERILLVDRLIAFRIK